MKGFVLGSSGHAADVADAERRAQAVADKAALERDAARYRWVRGAAYRSNGHLCINADADPDTIKTVDDFDAMVDAELAANAALEPPPARSNAK